MLLGREPECQRLDALLNDARRGGSGTLLVRGEPGIGKSSLLAYASSRATGMAVLGAQGYETDSELAFAGLFELFRPVIRELDRLPLVQARALRGALALAPITATGRFSVAAATVGLLSLVAETSPLLVVVDDMHWLDAPSAEALLFAIRRLGAEGVAVLLSCRPGESKVFEESGMPILELRGLDRTASLALLQINPQPMAAVVAERLIADTAGNPLALLEIPSALTDGQLDGSEPLDETLPIGARIDRAFNRRIAGLSRETRSALLVTALSETDGLEPILAAAAKLGASGEALMSAESAHVVSIATNQIVFRHPLIRAAVFYGATPDDRRQAHRALAEVLDTPEGADARAWHLAAAAVGPDEMAADALAQAGLNARVRGGYAAAAVALERAARLTPIGVQHAERLLAAAGDLLLVGQLDRCVQLLDEALAINAESRFRADVQQLRAHIITWSGAPAEALKLLVEEGERIMPIDVDRGLAMLAQAAIVETMTGDVKELLATCELAYSIARREQRMDDANMLAIYANALLLSGQAPEALPILSRCEAASSRTDPLTANPVLVQPTGHARVWIEEYTDARRVLERAVSGARMAGAAGLLPYPLACLAELDFRLGRWIAAFANASESLLLAEETGQMNESCFSAAILATVEAGLGRADDCRVHAEQARDGAERLGIDSILVYLGSALGLLELGLARADRAISHLEPVAHLVQRMGLGEPGVVWWTADLIEAYIRTDRPADARRELATFEQQADRTQRSWALATAARCHGLLADDAEFESHFSRALALHDRTDTPFERARTQLCFGERLRRLRRRNDARTHLHEAMQTFRQLDARPWANRTATELRATGEPTADQGGQISLQGLTSQELQVALAVAEGATNREAAQLLFLSSKTIEFHLANIYRKLGIHTRTALAKQLFGSPTGMRPPTT